MEFINTNLKNIYDQMYISLEGTPFDKYEKIKDHCSEDPDCWDLSQDEDGGIYDAYDGALYDYLKSKYDDFDE